MTDLKPTAQDTLVRLSLSGRTLNGRFQILEPLGEGGMGKVYKAIQLPLQRPVAVKVLIPPEGGTVDPHFRARFSREATLASKLRHPGTVRVLDFGDAEGVLFIVMEYLEGVTLAQVLADRGQLPWREVAVIVQQIARALREAHGLGIVHRDLKPSNIMLLGAGDPEAVKVLDFGLVKSFIPDEFKGHAPELTTMGVFLGSPAYMAPETARNTADPRSDVYALGVMMFEMLTGRTPFRGVSFLDMAVQHEVDEVPTVAQLRPDVVVPPLFEELIRHCLEKAADRRFQSMQELLDTLRPLLESADIATSMARTGPHALMSDSGLRTAGIADSGQRASLRDTGKLLAPGMVSQPGLAGAPALGGALQPRPAADPQAPVPSLFGAASASSGGAGAGKVVGGLLALAAAVAIGLALWPRGNPPVPVPAQVPAPAAAPTPAPATASTPAIASTPGPATPPPAPVVVSPVVHFHVASEPVGAKVMQGTRLLGVTPLVFDLEKDAATGEASVELELRMKGFEPMTVILGGPGPDVIVKQKLEKATRRTQKKKLRKVIRYRQQQRSAAVAAAGPEIETRIVPAKPAEALPARPVVISPTPNPAAPAGAAPAVQAPAAPRNVPPFVLDKDKLRREPLHLPEIFKTSHRGMSFSGMYRICLGVDGKVNRVDTVKSIPGADEEIAEGIREGWSFRPQKAPVCALYGLPVTVK